MATKFQYRKITNVFRAMDVDGDGYLTESDFEALASRWAAIQGQPKGRIYAIMMNWWATLLTADRDGDERVTLDDVMLIVDRLNEMPHAMATTALSMFDAVDVNGDGMISAREYNQLIVGWTGVPTDTDDIFDELDGDGDGYLSRTEFGELWAEFWSGDDQRASGSLVFGRIDVPAR